MGQVLVRNLDDAVIERLKSKAAARGTSLEQVAREALAAAAQLDDRKAWADRLDALRAQTTFDPTWDAVAVIRSYRDYDRMDRLLDEQIAAAEAKARADKAPRGDGGV
jgi:antitoxin FitA